VALSGGAVARPNTPAMPTPLQASPPTATSQRGDGLQDASVARQPIYDRALELVAYEVLFRPGAGQQTGKLDPDAATSSVILNTFAEIGLDNLVGQSLVHINVSRRFLLAADHPPLPADRVVLEVPGSIELDDEILTAIANLRSSGYRIALANLVYDRSRHRLVENADIVKIDVVGRDRKLIAQQVSALTPYSAQLLAAKVETYELFDACRSLGFDLYQGYFFCTPKIVQAKSIPSNHLDRLRLIARLEAPDIQFEELKSLIARDVGLSYRFLRYANSAFFSLRHKVDSVHDALVLLGEQTVKRWTTLIVLAGVQGKPHELIVTALVRARMCELIAGPFATRERDAYFTVGLFSVVDALLDAPIDEVVECLPFSDDSHRRWCAVRA
jgi:c-di-GMP phosphodiesterase